MDYKIEFYKNINSVSKNNIKKMGLEDMFEYYDGSDVNFLRFVSTLNNNNWKASKENEQDDCVVYKFFSDIYPGNLYIYFYNSIVDKQNYEQTMEVIKIMDINPESKNNIINISDYLNVDYSDDNKERKKIYKENTKTCNRIISKKKIALYALTGSFIALMGVTAGNLIAEKAKEDNDKHITSNLDNKDELVPGVSNQTFYEAVENAKNDQLEVYDSNSNNQQYWYSSETANFNVDEQNDLMKEKTR